MSVGFTPGPWMVHPIERLVSPVSDPETPICLLRYESFGVRCGDEEVRANAYLIAAAPDLLDASQRLLALPADCPDSDIQQLLEMFRTVVTRATGGEA